MLKENDRNNKIIIVEGFEFDADQMAEMNKNVKKEVEKEKDNEVIDIQGEFDIPNQEKDLGSSENANKSNNEMCD